MRNWPFLSAFSFFLLACHHSPEPPNYDYTFDYTVPANNNDTLIPVVPCGALTQYLAPDRYRYLNGCFNPSDNNQISFVRQDWSTFPLQHELCTFDFSTGELHVLTDQCFVEPTPDWSTRGWISFLGKNKQIWKINSMGDSLTQLSNASFNHSMPRWSRDGLQLIFWEDAQPYYDHVIYNLSGQPTDTIFRLIGAQLDWDGQNIVYNQGQNMGHIQGVFWMKYSNLEATQIESIPVNGTDSLCYSLDLEANTNVCYWTTIRQINRTDCSGHRRQVARITNSNWYGRVSVSGDGTKLLLERTDRQRLDVCTIEERFHLYLMEADGSGERKILFPE